MDTSTHHHNNELVAMMLCTAVLMCCAVQVSAQASATSPGREAQGSDDWHKYEADAQQNLKRASQCVETSPPEHSCDHFLAAAASDYRSILAMGKDSEQRMGTVVRVADGLRRAGRASNAIDLLRRHEPNGDGNLFHLLGDILYSIGDYQNAGIAYRKWIETGCKGYLLSFDEHGLWASPIKADPCTSLPAELRARLEDLRDVAHGEPTNLPPQNKAPVRITSR